MVTEEMVAKAVQAIKAAWWAPYPPPNVLPEGYDEMADQAARAALKAVVPDGPKWRHKKRGTQYVEIGRAFAQVAHHPIKEMTCVVVYQGENGDLWVRNAVEFDDGRFEPA